MFLKVNKINAFEYTTKNHLLLFVFGVVCVISTGVVRCLYFWKKIKSYNMIILVCFVIYIRHVGRTKPRVGHTDWQHDNRDHCQWPAKPDCPRWVFVRFVVLECSVSDDVEGKGSHGDSWCKPLPTPTKPGKDSNANHLLNVIVKTVGLCCVQQYISIWVFKNTI